MPRARAATHSTAQGDQGFPDGSAGKESSAMQETKEVWVQSLAVEDPLEKENDNPLQYSCLKVPWTEESGQLQSKESQRVGHD